MNAAHMIRDVLAPLLPNCEIQFGEWVDTPGAAQRYLVIRPAGGMPVELVRRPMHTLMLVGLDGGDKNATSEAAELIVETLRADSGRAVFLQPAEPVFMATQNGRPIFEIAVSAITN